MEEFLKKLNELKDLALYNGGFVTREQIKEIFPEMNDDQNKLIEEYLVNNRIGIEKALEDSDYLSKEDIDYLSFYLEDLEALDIVDEDMKKVLIMNVLNKDEVAKEKLINAYLPSIVDIAKLYAGGNISMADLIGEGNVALAIAVNMLDCIETPEDADALIVKQVMNAMEEFAGIEISEAEKTKKALTLVVKVTNKAKELNKDLLRKVTVEELSKESGISVKKIKEAIRISDGCLEYIEKPEDMDE